MHSRFRHIDQGSFTIVFLTIIHATLVFGQNVVWTSTDWNAAGLTNEKVLSVIGFDVARKVVAGTDKGLYIADLAATNWTKIPCAFFSGTIVEKLAAIEQQPYNPYVLYAAVFSETQGGKGCVVVGNGTSLVKVQEFTNVQSLFVTKNLDTVYVGSQNQIAYSVRNPDSSYSAFIKLSVPGTMFGSTKPRCSGLLRLSGLKILYAGGYDEGNPSFLGCCATITNGTIEIFKKLKVTSLAEQQGRYSYPNRMLFAGTADSCVQKFDPVLNRWTALPRLAMAQNKQDSIRHVAASAIMYITNRPDEYQMWEALPMVATNTGIYYLPRQPQQWQKIGQRMLLANCLGVAMTGSYNSFNLYAGSNTGMYMMSGDVPTGIETAPHAKAEQSVRVMRSGNDVRLIYSTAFAGNLLIELFDGAGKKIFGVTVGCSANAGSVTLPISRSVVGASRLLLAKVTPVEKHGREVTQKVIVADH